MIQTISVIDICNLILDHAEANGSALELGSGEGGMVGRLNVARKVGVDHWVPSLEKSKASFPSVETVEWDIRHIGERYGPREFDVVCGFDVLEHFTLDEARGVMDAAEQIAAKLVLWWGPLEPKIRVIEQNGNPSMAHKRTIDLCEFEGYEMVTFPNYWQEPPLRDDTGFLAWKRLP